MENYDNLKEEKSSFKNKSQKTKELPINDLSNILPKKENNKQM